MYCIPGSGRLHAGLGRLELHPAEDLGVPAHESDTPAEVLDTPGLTRLHGRPQVRAAELPTEQGVVHLVQVAVRGPDQHLIGSRRPVAHDEGLLDRDGRHAVGAEVVRGRRTADEEDAEGQAEEGRGCFVHVVSCRAPSPH